MMRHDCRWTGLPAWAAAGIRAARNGRRLRSVSAAGVAAAKLTGIAAAQHTRVTAARRTGVHSAALGAIVAAAQSAVVAATVAAVCDARRDGGLGHRSGKQPGDGEQREHDGSQRGKRNVTRHGSFSQEMLVEARPRRADTAHNERERDSGSRETAGESADRRGKQRLVAAGGPLVASDVAAAIRCNARLRAPGNLQGEHEPGDAAAAVAAALTRRAGVAGVRQGRVLLRLTRRCATGGLRIIRASGSATARLAARRRSGSGVRRVHHRSRQQGCGQRDNQADTANRGHQSNDRSAPGSESRGELGRKRARRNLRGPRRVAGRSSGRSRQSREPAAAGVSRLQRPKPSRARVPRLLSIGYDSASRLNPAAQGRSDGRCHF